VIAALLFLPVLLITLGTIDALITRRKARELAAQRARMTELGACIRCERSLDGARHRYACLPR